MADGKGPKITTLGGFLGARLCEVVDTVFAVPGDFNLILLDQLVDKEGLNMVWCCNELNAGYAADGYARRKGVGALVVTYGVGGMSCINAVAGAFSEDLPVIVISGGPNSNDGAANHVLHHSTGSAEDYGQQIRAYKEFTCAQVLVRFVEEAHHQIDFAISQALKHRKPAYIEICCNIAGLKHPSFSDPPVPFALEGRHTNHASLAAAVADAAAALNAAVKPVIIGGTRLRPKGRRQALEKVMDAAGYPVAVTCDAKGFVDEEHPDFVGTYWGAISTSCVNETVEAADLVLVVGAVWTDYSSLGYSVLLPPSKTIAVDEARVTIKGGATYGCIDMQDFLEALAAKLTKNTTAMENYQRMFVPAGVPTGHKPDDALTSKVMQMHLQRFLDSKHALLAETGDSWFTALKTKLPRGCPLEVQMRWGSIGWSVGATLGYSLAAAAEGQRLVSLIGDGSFQLTAQEVSTMLRFGANPIILLINNEGYTIEVEIHDGPYNKIQVWDYVGVVTAFCNGAGKLFATRVKTEADLLAALEEAKARPDHVCFLELIIHRDDCSRELLEFGARVASANSRAPKPM